MLYCATVNYWISVENSRQKLAVVSDLPRSLVPVHMIFFVWTFFCKEEHMLQFLKRLFCIHEFDYESDIFAEVECRKCSKTKPE